MSRRRQSLNSTNAPDGGSSLARPRIRRQRGEITATGRRIEALNINEQGTVSSKVLHSPDKATASRQLRHRQNCQVKVNRSDIETAKTRLPLPELLRVLGFSTPPGGEGTCSVRLWEVGSKNLLRFPSTDGSKHGVGAIAVVDEM